MGKVIFEFIGIKEEGNEGVDVAVEPADPASAAIAITAAASSAGRQVLPSNIKVRIAPFDECLPGRPPGGDTVKILRNLPVQVLIRHHRLRDVIDNRFIIDDVIGNVDNKGFIDENLFEDIRVECFIGDDLIDDVADECFVTDDFINDIADEYFVTNDTVYDILNQCFAVEDVADDLIEYGFILDDFIGNVGEKGLIVDDGVRNVFDEGVVLFQGIDKLLFEGLILQEFGDDVAETCSAVGVVGGSCSCKVDEVGGVVECSGRKVFVGSQLIKN